MTASAPAWVALGNQQVEAAPEARVIYDGCGVVDLTGGVQVYCRTPAQARDLATAFTTLAGVPKALQDAVNEAYDFGAGLGTDELAMAQDAAIQAVENKLAGRKP